MLEWILTTLAEFGLIREDYLHRKRINKKEKEDGIKRPFQKYLLQPSSIMIFAVLILSCLSAFLFFSYQRVSIFPENTKKEMAEISDRLEKWKDKYGKYPTDLNELIGNNPIRHKWKNDSWNRPYRYSVSENGNMYLIVSAGPDGKFETEDDIKSN